MIWWEKSSVAQQETEAIRGVLSRLDDEAGPARRRWALEGPALLARCLQMVQQGEALLLSDTPLRFHQLAQEHDRALQLAFSAAPLLADATQVLGALRRFADHVDARLADLTRQRKGLPIWRRGALSGDFRALQGFQEQLVAEEIVRLSAERKRLIGVTAQLLEQGRQIRERLAAAYNGTAGKWLAARSDWLQIGNENWERAQNGLRLRPLPALDAPTLNGRLEGIVKWYDASRRRGIITPLNGGQDVHLPRSSLHNVTRLHPGQRVGFSRRESSIGPWAVDVILIR